MQLFEDTADPFPTSYIEILQRVSAIEPRTYGRTRNFINGAVTYLSPYISRGIISTKFVLYEVLQQGYKPAEIEKFIQELAWRDYWQQVWIDKGTGINQDLKHAQKEVSNTEIPKAIVNANTGIDAIDSAIREFYKTGYLHNHLRMYIAAIACNMGQSHWKTPAQWMYYHLLDADWASNALSWQWVAGANANKKYVANQENINKYCLTQQKNTFLDVPYDAFNEFGIPEVLKETIPLVLTTPLPKKQHIAVDANLPTYLYNFYNLDPLWKKDKKSNSILLLEPSHFKDYPIGQNSMDFMLSFCRENIPNIQIYVGAFHELLEEYDLNNIHYKEHPLNAHYTGTVTPRAWMFDVQGYYPSFFSFWKKCKKQLRY